MKKKKKVERNDPKDLGTPETRSKLQPDPILWLFYAKTINGSHLHAAQEIVLSHEVITAEVRLKAADPNRVGGGGNTHEYDTLWQIKMAKRYREWREEMRRQGISNSIADAVIIDRESCRDVARRHRCRIPTVSATVAKSLDLYARVAGYLT